MSLINHSDHWLLNAHLNKRVTIANSECSSPKMAAVSSIFIGCQSCLVGVSLAGVPRSEAADWLFPRALQVATSARGVCPL